MLSVKKTRPSVLPASTQWHSVTPAWKLTADNPRLVSLVEQARRMELADTVGTIGITIALVGLVWMLGKCGPALFPGAFQ